MLLAAIDAKRGGNLSSAIRLFVLASCRRGELDAAAAEAEAAAEAPVGAPVSRGYGPGLVSKEREMASVVNLNRFRKAKKRAAAERRAAENRTAFGRTKPERKLVERERERADRDLEGKKIE